MKTKPITEYNPKALMDIQKHLNFSDIFKDEPVYKTITHTDFESIGVDLITILNAIETIGHNGNDTDLGTCAGLAQIAQKILPLKKLCFLDSLLIKKENSKEVFNKISEV